MTRTFRELSTRMRQAFGNLSSVDLLVLVLLVYLAFTIALSLHLLPLYGVLVNNADVLFVEDVARDLNNGGLLFNWRLTQAPYIFPDIAIARLLALAATNVGDVGVTYHLLYGLILIGLVYCVCRTAKVPAFAPLAIAATIFSTTYMGQLNGDGIAQYFTLIGHHSGVALPILVVFIFTGLYLRSGNNAHLLVVFVLAFLGVISDSLVGLALLPPALVFAAALHLRRHESAQRALRSLVPLILAVLLGKAFGYTNPFPQDREYMRFILGLWHFPDSTVGSIKLFFKEFFEYFAASIVSAMIAVSFFVAYGMAIAKVRRIHRGEAPADSLTALLSWFVILGPAATILVQLVLGLYGLGGIEMSRQWAPLVYLSIAFGAIIACETGSNTRNATSLYACVALVLMAVILTRGLYGNRGVIKDQKLFPGIVACMKENKLPAGNLYVGDYWIARPIRLYSGGAFGVSPMLGGIVPFTNASNVAWAREANPRFIIAGNSIKYEDVVARFGAPNGEHCRMSAGASEIRVLDYTGHEDVVTYLKKNALNSN